MKRRARANNKGYTMVELVIVIGIIGILSAMSLVTWRAVDNAANKKAVSTFESELTTLRTTTMAQDSSLAMRLYYDSSKNTYYIERGCLIYGGLGYKVPVAGVDSVADLDYFNYQGTSNPVKILKNGSIIYNGTDVKDMSSGLCIHFNKSDGSIEPTYGSAGKYIFKDKGGNVIANVTLNKDTGLYKETYED